MEAILVLADTDLDRFRAWIDEQAPLLERAFNEGRNAAPVIYGWEWRPFSCYYEFCTVTPTPKRVAEQQLDIAQRSAGLAKMRGEPAPSDEDTAAFAWEMAAGGEYIEAITRRGKVRYDNGPRWLYQPKDDRGQFRDKLVAAWIQAENFTVGRLRVTFWRDDRQPGYDALLDALKTDFAGTWQEDAAAGFPGKTSAPSVGNRQIDDAAPDPAGENLSGLIDKENDDWYRWLLKCKTRFSNGDMTWEEIGRNFSVGGKTAKRKLAELQARNLPGLEDWPKRRN